MTILFSAAPRALEHSADIHNEEVEMRHACCFLTWGIVGCTAAPVDEDPQDGSPTQEVAPLQSMVATLALNPEVVVGEVGGARRMATLTTTLERRDPDVHIRMDHVAGDAVVDRQTLDHTPHVDIETDGLAAWFPNVGAPASGTETYEEKIYLDCEIAGSGSYQLTLVDKELLTGSLEASDGYKSILLEVECFEPGTAPPTTGPTDGPEVALFSVNPEGGPDPIETVSVSSAGVVSVGSAAQMGPTGPNAAIAGTGPLTRTSSPGYLVYGAGTYGEQLSLYPLGSGGTIAAPAEGSPFEIDIGTFDLAAHPTEELVYVTSGESGHVQAVSIAGGIATAAQEPMRVCRDWAGEVAYDSGFVFVHCGAAVYLYQDEGEGLLSLVSSLEADSGFAVADGLLITIGFPENGWLHRVNADGSTSELSGPHTLARGLRMSAEGCGCGSTYSTGEFVCWAFDEEGMVTETHRETLSTLTREFSHRGGFIAAINHADYSFLAWEVDPDCALAELPGSGHPVSGYVYSMGTGPLVE
jgi:hypothetical protein